MARYLAVRRKHAVAWRCNRKNIGMAASSSAIAVAGIMAAMA